jgi:hypothetical protein
MNERIVRPRLPYKVAFVRKRHRTFEFANLQNDRAVMIRGE